MNKFYLIISIIFIICLNNCQKVPKPYTIYFQENNLCVVMEHPTYGIIELNRPNWGNVKLEEVAEDIFNNLQKSKINDDVILWVQFINSQTDKYGNVTYTYEDHEIGRIPMSEARKYKSWEYLDQNYQITHNIRKAAFGEINSSNNVEDVNVSFQKWKQERQIYDDYIIITDDIDTTTLYLE